MVATTELFDKWSQKLSNLGAEVKASLIELVKEMGGEVEIPYEVTDYCSTSIVYYDDEAMIAEVEMVSYDEKNDSIVVYFSEGGCQDICVCNFDDVLSIVEMVLCVKNNNFEDDEE